MKKYLIIPVLIGLSFGALSETVNEQILQKSMKPWQPLSISESQKIITVTLNEQRVTDQIYSTIVKNAICTPLWLEENKKYLKGTKEINVLNQYNKQGYILESPKQACDEIGKSNNDDAAIRLMGATRGWMSS